MGNRLYQTTGGRFAVPRFGRITLENTIRKADPIEYLDQWSTNGAKTKGNKLLSKESLKDFNKLVLSTNSLKSDPELVGVKTDLYL